MPAPDPDAIEIIEWEGGYSVLFPSWPNGCPRTLAARAKAILRNLLFHPLQMAVLVWIGGLSIRKKWRGKNEWKGRNLQLQ